MRAPPGAAGKVQLFLHLRLQTSDRETPPHERHNWHLANKSTKDMLPSSPLEPLCLYMVIALRDPARSIEESTCFVFCTTHIVRIYRCCKASGPNYLPRCCSSPSEMAFILFHLACCATDQESAIAAEKNEEDPEWLHACVVHKKHIRIPNAQA